MITAARIPDRLFPGDIEKIFAFQELIGNVGFAVGPTIGDYCTHEIRIEQVLLRCWPIPSGWLPHLLYCAHCYSFRCHGMLILSCSL